jgi:predicted RNA-binding Zn ribbon-like protein
MPTREWLCIDFTRTRGWEARDRTDDELEDFGGLVAWAEDHGVLSSDAGASMRRAAAQAPAEASRAFGQAVDFRRGLYAVLRAAAEGAEPRPADLAIVNASLAEAGAHRVLGHRTDGLTWEWSPHATPLTRVLWPIALSAAELLTGEEARRLKFCAADDCGWIFVDRSRNASRRWCDMADCGNRAKVRRYRERQRTSDSG